MQLVGMKPRQVRAALREQLHECLQCLDLLRNGEGVLCKTATSVNGIGKLDVYQYIYFLALHATRCLHQLEKIRAAAGSRKEESTGRVEV